MCLQHLFASARPSIDFSTLDQFMFEFLRGLSPAILHFTKTLSISQKHLLERFWQMEFYRIATALLPATNYVSADVGRVFGSDCAVDFYVNDKKKWLVEFLIEGDKLASHVSRFAPGGSYSTFPYNEYVIVDFRMEIGPPKKCTIADHDKVWFVMVSSDRSRATIIRKGRKNQEILFSGGLNNVAIFTTNTNLHVVPHPEVEAKIFWFRKITPEQWAPLPSLASSLEMYNPQVSLQDWIMNTTPVRLVSICNNIILV
jgi:hypothetical protein